MLHGTPKGTLNREHRRNSSFVSTYVTDTKCFLNKLQVQTGLSKVKYMFVE